MNELQTSNIQPQNNQECQNNKAQNGKVYDIRERLLLFSKRALRLCGRLPRMPECKVIKRQLAKAATSVGANFEEADGALTKKDFINKVAIARKEAKEAKYWLRVINEAYLPQAQVREDEKEAEEIICILSAILKKAGYRFRV